MLQGFRSLPNGITVRPARSGDKAFFKKLHRSARTDLQALNLEPELFEELLDLQDRARESGHGSSYPHMAEFVLEKLGDAVGRLALAPEPDGMRIVDLTFIPALRDQGLGTAVIGALQQAGAAMGGRLVCVALRTSPDLKMALTLLGFTVDQSTDAADMMSWTPGRPASPPVPVPQAVIPGSA